MYAILSYNPTATVRPFRVTVPTGTRSFSTLPAALSAARTAMRSEHPAPHGDPLRPCLPGNAPSPTEPQRDPDTACVDRPCAVYRITGKRCSGVLQGAVTVRRDITARGRSAAIRAFCKATNCDTVISIRHLSRRNPDGKTARVRKGTAMLSAKRRRQRSAAETRHLRRAGYCA
jgi:hypothetical protein